MAVDLFSLVMRVKAEGTAQAVAELRGIEQAGQQATLSATNFANAWQGALLRFKGTAAQVAAFKTEFSKGFFDEKLIAGMNMAGEAGRRASEGNAAWSRGVAKIREEHEAAAAAMRQKASAGGMLFAAMRPLVALYAGFSLFNFVKHTIEGAGALHELAQRTGATVRMLSILQFAGAQSGVSTEQIAQGFRGLALALGRARDGNDQAIAAFQRLGLSAQQLKGMSVDEVFQRIVVELGKMPDGFEKAETAQKVFGRSGAMLLPLLEDLAEQGFANVAREAEKMGAVIDAKTAKNADAFSDSLIRLKVALTGLLRETLMPILPALTLFVGLLASAVRHLKDLATGGVANFGFKVGQELAGGGSAEGLPDPGGAVPRDVSPLMAGLGPLEETNLSRSGGGSAVALPGAPNMGNLRDSLALAQGMFAPDRLSARGGAIGTRNGRIAADLSGYGVQGGETGFDQFEDRVKQQAAVVSGHFASLGTNLATTLANGFSAGLSAALQGKNPFKAFGNVALSGLGSIMGQMGQAMIQHGVILLNLLPFLSNPFSSGPALIAAGIALSALGSMLGGIASAPGGSTGGGGKGGLTDTTTKITLTADGLGGRNAPASLTDRMPTLMVDSPRGQRVLATSVRGAARRNIK